MPIPSVRMTLRSAEPVVPVRAAEIGLHQVVEGNGRPGAWRTPRSTPDPIVTTTLAAALFGGDAMGRRERETEMNRPVERLDSLKDLAKYEDEVLDAIADTPHGALLFLVRSAAASSRKLASTSGRVCRPN